MLLHPSPCSRRLTIVNKSLSYLASVERGGPRSGRVETGEELVFIPTASLCLALCSFASLLVGCHSSTVATLFSLISSTFSLSLPLAYRGDHSWRVWPPRQQLGYSLFTEMGLWWHIAVSSRSHMSSICVLTFPCSSKWWFLLPTFTLYLLLWFECMMFLEGSWILGLQVIGDSETARSELEEVGQWSWELSPLGNIISDPVLLFASWLAMKWTPLLNQTLLLSWCSVKVHGVKQPTTRPTFSETVGLENQSFLP